MTKRMMVAVAMLAAGTAMAGQKEDAAKARAEIQQMLGFVPEYFKAVPDTALPGAWEEVKTLEATDKTAIPCKYKELIGLAVAAQVPSRSFVYLHSKIAKQSGATDAEVNDAIMMAASTRHWSTFFNGMQLDESKFRSEIKTVTDNIKKAIASGMQPPAPMTLSDQASALKDMEQSFGFAPEWAKRFPAASFAGAYRELRDVELGETAVPGKYKNLISLAVAAQIPCKYCMIADSEFAKVDGATDAEIAEAVAMGSLTRHWATLTDGLLVDEATFRKDVDKMVKALTMPKGVTAKK
ncbi:MAG: carboxymuconolactone decarboxylase family protein [Myxococcaceae bacterium]